MKPDNHDPYYTLKHEEAARIFADLAEFEDNWPGVIKIPQVAYVDYSALCVKHGDLAYLEQAYPGQVRTIDEWQEQQEKKEEEQREWTEVEEWLAQQASDGDQ